ncbi:MAG TPA: hypothetical protein VFL28_10305 [bacterium]|nr:hypothetical protein [bacterium]
MANSVRPLVRAAFAAAAVASLTGCGGVQLPWARQAPPAAPAVRSVRIVVVDLVRATHAHPRWPEVDAVDRRTQDLVGQLSAVTASAGTVAPPAVDLTPEIRAAAQQESARLVPEFRRRMDAEVQDAHAAGKRELDAYAAKVRADQQRQFDAKRAELEAAIQKTVQDKAAALQQDSAQFQQQTLEQYRLPLLNLRLKLDAAATTDRKESERLSQQMQTLTKERDDKIAAHDKANQDALAAFQKQQQDAFTAQLKALSDGLAKEGQRLVDQKVAEITARMHTDLSAKQAQINAELSARMRADMQSRQQAIISSARSQIDAAHSQSLQTLQVRVTSLRAQISEAQAERARLMAAIMADLRVDTAELAQQKGWDVVLTLTVDAPDAPDVTALLIDRLNKK